MNITSGPAVKCIMNITSGPAVLCIMVHVGSAFNDDQFLLTVFHGSDGIKNAFLVTVSCGLGRNDILAPFSIILRSHIALGLGSGSGSGSGPGKGSQCRHN